MTFIQARLIAISAQIYCYFVSILWINRLQINVYYTAILRKLWHLTFENYMPTGQVKSLCLGLRCFTPKLEVHTDQAVSLCV